MSLREDIEALANEDGGSLTAGAAQIRRELRVILDRYPEPKHEARKPHPSTMAGR